MRNPRVKSAWAAAERKMEIAEKKKDAKIGVESLMDSLDFINAVRKECPMDEDAAADWSQLDSINKYNKEELAKLQYIENGKNKGTYFFFHNVDKFMDGIKWNHEKKEFAGAGWMFGRALYE